MKKLVVGVLLLTALATAPALLPADDDFDRFSKEMLESTQKSLQVETLYHDCLLKAADKEEYFVCRDNRDEALNLSGRAVGQMLNPDSEFVWDKDVRALYLGVSERAIQSKQDTIYCLEGSSSIDQYEQCLRERMASHRQ